MKQRASLSACRSSEPASAPGSSLQCVRPLRWWRTWYPSLKDRQLSDTWQVQNKGGAGWGRAGTSGEQLRSATCCRPAAAGNTQRFSGQRQGRGAGKGGER